MRAMENDPRQKQPGEKFMVKELSEKKLNQRHKSKIAWNAAEYMKYKDRVELARIEVIRGLISDFNKWLTLSEEEEKKLNKIIKELKNYLEYLGE